MAKRSNFKRNARDFYPTPAPAVTPLIPHLETHLRYSEPCAGDGSLIKYLTPHGINFVQKSDLEPQAEDILTADFAEIQNIQADCVLTNPPWAFGTLSELLDLAIQRWKVDAWLLLNSDFIFNKQSVPYLRHCSKIVTIGRVKWIPDSKYASKDNAVWMLFHPTQQPCRPAFFGRAE